MKKKLILAKNILMGKELKVVENSAIIINGSKIEKILDRKEIKNSEEFEVIDLGHMTILPGMIECHNHLCIDARIHNHLELLRYSSEADLTLIAIKGLKDDLLSGVTTARCMADKFNIDIKLKKKVEDGTILGPYLLTAGIQFVLGTDGNHGLLYKEVRYAIQLGADKVTALKGITSNAAIVCGLENEIGSIEEGLIADIIAVDKNPIDNWHTLAKVNFVMKQGKVYSKPENCSVEKVKSILN